MFRIAVLVMVSATVPALAANRVEYRDRTAKDGKPVSVTCEIISESIAGLKLKLPTGATKDVPATDIVEVVYDTAGQAKLTYEEALRNEKRSAEAGIESYAKLAKLIDPKSPLARHIQFRTAALMTQQAGEVSSERAKAVGAEAVKALRQFLADHSNAWQATAATRLLANVLLDGGDAAGAQAAYQKLLTTPDLSAEAKAEIDFQMIDLLLRAKDYAAVETRVRNATKNLPAGSPMKIRADVMLLGCPALTDANKLADVAAKLQAVIDEKGRDPAAKAAAYNTLGDCQLAAGRKREALWSYLYVDVVFYQDKDEHLKAMDRLARLFEELKEDNRALYYKDKLRRLRG